MSQTSIARLNKAWEPVNWRAFAGEHVEGIRQEMELKPQKQFEDCYHIPWTATSSIVPRYQGGQLWRLVKLRISSERERSRLSANEASKHVCDVIEENRVHQFTELWSRSLHDTMSEQDKSLCFTHGGTLHFQSLSNQSHPGHNCHGVMMVRSNAQESSVESGASLGLLCDLYTRSRSWRW